MSPGAEPSAGINALTRFANVVRHPLRLRIIRHLELVDEASPVRMKDAFGEPLGNVAYHVGALANLGVISLKRKVPRRGAAEHFYVLTDYAETVLKIIVFIESPWPDTRPNDDLKDA